MNLIETIKNKNFLSVAAIVGVILIAVVFLVSVLADRKEKPKNPAAPAAASREKTLEELINDLTASADEKKIKPFPSEDIKSLTAPINYNENLNAEAKNNKMKNYAPAPIPEADIKSLTAPANK